jgi:hypothetical protein
MLFSEGLRDRRAWKSVQLRATALHQVPWARPLFHAPWLARILEAIAVIILLCITLRTTVNARPDAFPLPDQTNKLQERKRAESRRTRDVFPGV